MNQVTENTSHLISRLQEYERFLLPVLAVVTLAVFSPVLWHDFVNYDDPAFVYDNPFIQSGVTLDSLKWAFTSGHEANWIPLSWITHMLDIQLFGLNPAGHHAVNMLLHTASSCLLFLLLRRATGGVWQSFAVACLFALHPLHVESVAWAAERKDVLSTFFLMLTLNAYISYAQRPDKMRYLTTLGLYVLGLLSKPMLVTLPLVLLLLDWWPCGRFVRVACVAGQYRHTSFWRLGYEKIPFFLLSAGSSVITYLVQQTAGELPQGYTIWSRLGKACIAYVTYLYKMVWPVDLAVLYPFSKYPPSSLAMLSSLLVLIIITGLVVWQGKRLPFLVTGWFWYLVTLLPVIGLIQIGAHHIADRYTYIPLTGIFVIIAWGLSLLFKKLRWGDDGLVIATIVLIVIMIPLTVKQLTYWKNSETLFTHTLAVTTDNWVAQNNLALVYLYDGRINKAIEHFKESIKAKPSYTLAYMNLGVAYLNSKQYQLAEETFKWVFAFQPDNETAHYNLGLVYLDSGRHDLVMQQHKKLVELQSSYAQKLLEEIAKVKSLNNPVR